MPTSIHEGDHVFNGTLVPRGISLPNGSVTSNSVLAGSNIDADKLEHRQWVMFAQPNTAAAAETRPVFVARGVGLITEIRVGSIAKAIGDSTVTVDVKKNGTSVLTAPVVLDNANTARLTEAASIDSAQDDLASGDWLEVVVTASAGTGTLPTGLAVQITVDHNGA